MTTEPELTPERAALAAEHFEWAQAFARRKARKHPIAGDEIESHVMTALVRAARGYEASRGVPFKGYAYAVLLGAVCHARRRVAQMRRVDLVPTYAIRVPSDEGTPEAIFEAETEIAGVLASLATLPPRHRELMSLLYTGPSVSHLKDVAAVLGISESSASRVHAEAVELIRRDCLGGTSRRIPSVDGRRNGRSGNEARILRHAETLFARSGPFNLPELASITGLSPNYLYGVRAALVARGRWPWPTPGQGRRFLAAC